MPGNGYGTARSSWRGAFCMQKAKAPAPNHVTFNITKMKNIRQFLFGMLFLLSAIPVSVYAYSGQYPWDPIYISPTQETINSQTRQNLKSQYGVNAFYGCYPCTNTDTSNPYTEATCLAQTQYCLENKTASTSTQCSSDYVYYNGRCVTFDDGCKEQFGILSLYSGKVDSQGKFICGCENGYTMSKTKNLCVSYTQSCKDDYGDNVYGVKEDKGIQCYCSSGYQMNSAGTACEKVATAPSVKDARTVNIPEGAIIKTISNPDVYIVKYKNGKQFKRLILSPSVFRSYGHLRWEDLITVSQETVDSFATSSFVQVAGDARIFELTPQGDTGEKRAVFINPSGYRLFNGITANSPFDYDTVYEINATDRDSYITK